MQTEMGRSDRIRRTALCLPEELSSSGPFSGPAALSPLRLGCG